MDIIHHHHHLNLNLLLPILATITTAAAAAATIIFLYSKYAIVPINWPILGMLPHLIYHVDHFHDFCIRLLNRTGPTFHFKGPWLSSMNLILTADPANVHHVMSKNFANFPKGPKFAAVFEILGDGIFNADADLWRYQRRVTHSFLSHPRFGQFLTETVRCKAENGLVPAIDSAWRGREEGEGAVVVDLEDLFGRFTFDTICTLVTGRDPRCLSEELPDAPFCAALDDAEEVIFYRQVVPETVWKVQRWLGVGKERKMKEAWETLDEFIYECLAWKRREMMMMKKKKLESSKDENERVISSSSSSDSNYGVDLLTLYMEDNNNYKEAKDGDVDSKFSDKFLRDMFLNLLIAGRDTTSTALTWFFYLLHKHPTVESKIRKEIKSLIKQSGGDITTIQPDQLSKLVYLHGALCETLRLYPPVPLERKGPIEPDVLPSGHRVEPGTEIIFNLYAMGRMEFIWGADCEEFKPERWITDRGNNRHEPSYKFVAFNAGPRTCLGKEMAFTQMKAVAVSILGRGYRLEVVDEESVGYEMSIILHTKSGLKAKVSKVRDDDEDGDGSGI